MELLIILILMPIAYIVQGLVLSTLWGWFIVPIGLTAIGKAHAIGISAMIGMITNHVDQHKDDRDYSEKIGAFIGSTIVGPFLVLLVGYIAKQFM